jgi:hypothetical protein
MSVFKEKDFFVNRESRTLESVLQEVRDTLNPKESFLVVPLQLALNVFQKQDYKEVRKDKM